MIAKIQKLLFVLLIFSYCRQRNFLVLIITNSAVIIRLLAFVKNASDYSVCSSWVVIDAKIQCRFIYCCCVQHRGATWCKYKVWKVQSHHSSCENKKKNASDCSQLLHILNFFEKIRNLAENLYDGGSKLGLLGFKNRQPSNCFTNVRILLKTLWN